MITEQEQKEVISELMTTYDISVFDNDKFEDLCSLCKDFIKFNNGELTLEEIKQQQEKKIKERNKSICRCCKRKMNKDDEFYFTGICSICRDRNSR